MNEPALENGHPTRAPASLGPTDVTVIFGQRGSGKSTLGAKLARLYQRRFVFDRLREWSGNSTCRVERFTETVTLLSRLAKTPDKGFEIAFQFDIDEPRKSEQFSEVMRLCYKWGTVCQKNLAVVIEEVHHWATPVSIDRWLFESVMTGRHAHIALICNSQRPASVHKGLVSQASHLFIGKLHERRDMEYLAEYVPHDIIQQLPGLQVGEFFHYSPGHTPVKITGCV